MAAMPLVKLWLDRCDVTHNSSCSLADPSFVPTRLIDLSGKFPKLKVVAKSESGVKYATLSHCWGTIKRPVLTGQALPSFCSRIPPAALSTTFKDAMMIAQYLGFAYIWIDSLCIIQDSSDDWRREAALMSLVYGCSGLNISAAGAADGSIGCFFEQQESFVKYIKEHISSGVSSNGTNSPDGPLMRRGWCLQERLLAPRSLLCSRSQLFWECDGLYACELYPQGYELQGKGRRLRRSNLDLGSTTFSAVTAWEEVVELYCMCDLTMSRDRLVAISGLARAAASPMLGQYFAGLWRNGMEFQLCWYQGIEWSSRPDVYRAPSWSWASIDGPKVFYSQEVDISAPPKNLFVSVRDVVIQYLEKGNPFGEIVSGTVSINCAHLLRISIGNVEGLAELYTEIFIEECSTKTIIRQDCTEDFIPGESGAPIDIFALPMMDMHGGDICGLLLVPTGLSAGQYRRIGHFGFPYQDDPFSAEFEQILLSGRGKVGSDAYAKITRDKSQNELRIIDII
ncbi:hypothetical protein VTL71DRAFT_11240 [Oculimacula yallundae]|uniref:Heterokaryon incompatibility domain-containing protein n=1 Tax=Oculimacula yallundae TaxID=86028 RepID=A0ABR4CVE7_9HELO